MIGTLALLHRPLYPEARRVDARVQLRWFVLDSRTLAWRKVDHEDVAAVPTTPTFPSIMRDGKGFDTQVSHLEATRTPEA
jgi:hypothetical protein